MSSRRSASIYILIACLLIVGILIFAFKDRLLSFVSERVFGVNSDLQDVSLEASAASVINLQVLAKEDFANLKNNVLYFDFNRVGKPLPSTVSGAQAPAWQPVYLGNANPFLTPKKDKP
jgi:hypothetical protein